MKFSSWVQKKLIVISLWHFVWLSVLSSMIFTGIMSLILRGKIAPDYMITGSVVSLIVASCMIFLIQQIRNIEKRARASMAQVNLQLNQEIENRKTAQREAETANRAKSEFLANMSHELRTPLNHIIGFTELMIDKEFGPINPTQEEYLNDVLHSSHHLLSLVNDILDLTKVESGKVELESKEIHLKSFMKDCMMFFKEKAMEKGLDLSVQVGGDHCGTIQGDEQKLKQILYNLLSNAIKFTPEGGTILLSADLLPPSPLNNAGGGARGQAVKIGEDGKEPSETTPLLCISVSDSGIGIDPEDMDRIFNPFEQGDGSASRSYRGTGLGLSLTKKLVELHGGTIWVESEGRDKGSSFRFVLP